MKGLEGADSPYERINSLDLISQDQQELIGHSRRGPSEDGRIRGDGILTTVRYNVGCYGQYTLRNLGPVAVLV